ncbi:hypothetical protein EDC04DRAFT_2941620 [Pisolithus marmoratus]|nr:hypothetical protein EDC04DRAFT_2941620 [Pisolithus marmoratus]
MHSETSTLPLLDYALPGISTVQQYQTLACRCHLDHNSAAGPGCGPASTDVLEPQRLTSPTNDVCHGPISEFPGCSSIFAPLPVPDSSLVGHLNREQDTAQVALPLGCATNENRASIACGYWWDTQGHTSGQLTNHNITLSSPYATGLLQFCAIEQPSKYPEDYRNISAFGDLAHGSAGPTIGLGSMPPFHGQTSVQMINSNATWSDLSSSLLPSLQEPHLSEDLINDNVSLPPEQVQTEMFYNATDATVGRFFHTSCPTNSLVPSQSNSASHPPLEHPEYLPVHPHHTMPAGLPDFHGFHAGSKVDLHTAGTIDNHTAHTLSGHPLPTLSNHGEQLFDNHAAYILDGHIAGMTSVGVDDHGNVDNSESNPEQVVCSHPRSSLPPNQLALSSRELHSHDRVLGIAGGNTSGTFHHARRFATHQPQTPARLSKARLACDRNLRYPCGWRDDDGKICGMPITYGNCANHFAAIHEIKNMAWNAKVICRWCSSKAQKEVKRKSLLRHLREVHLHCLRSEKETPEYGLYADAIDKPHSALLPSFGQDQRLEPLDQRPVPVGQAYLVVH